MPSDSSGGNVWIYIVLLLVLIGFNAFFAMSELAIVSVNENRVRKLAQEGNKKAVKLLRLIEQPTGFLSTIQIGVTLSGFLASAVAADTFADMIVSALGHSVPISPSVLRLISIIVITILLSYVTLVLGELVPKRVAMKNSEGISYAVAGILSGMMTGLRPVVWFLTISTNGVLRLLRIDPNEEPEENTEEEIRFMLDAGNESGHIAEIDREMITNIFEFDDRTVEDIMTHRTEIIAVEDDSSLDEIASIAVKTGYSRIPVFDEDLDNVTGILYAKDLLEFVAKDHPNFNINELTRDPMYVVESTTCNKLLAQFQEKKIQMAIVVDEYGGTAGLVTMEDLLESIVGNIQDEYDNEEEDIILLSENHFLVDGIAPLEEVFEYFHLHYTEEKHDDFDTIGGYILSQLGEIPQDDEHPSIQIENVVFTIQCMADRRVKKLEAEVIHEEIILTEPTEQGEL